MDLENNTNSIPNEGGFPSVDESNVVESEPVWTSERPERKAAVAATEETPAGDETTTTAEESTITPVEEPIYQPKYTPEQITQMAEAADYKPDEIEVNFVDELGNFDPVLFAEFMKTNNQSVFDKALKAGNARRELTQIEGDTWAAVEKSFPEIAGNDTLTKALRGARIQDVIAGGDGDLTRLAKDIVGPMRDNKIQAIEDVNRQITEQKKLETFVPENNAPERAEPSLMSQLQGALQSGDTERANSIRHAIRKERINANNS